jgi:hypothetical protein
MPQHTGNNGGGGPAGANPVSIARIGSSGQRTGSSRSCRAARARSSSLPPSFWPASSHGWPSTRFRATPSLLFSVSASGLHVKLPLGFDAATIVPVKRQLKQEFGFKLKKAGFISIDPNTLPLHMAGSHSLILRPQPLVRHPTIARHSWSRNKGRRTE